jgi:serine/threonine protein phosphatase PrpC
LLDEANEAGGRDNITIVVARFDLVDQVSAPETETRR